jgi:ADP-heptose:LPS heptosyltransferase
LKRDRILIGKTFGIGNAVMAVPMIRSISEANPRSTIDVLVGTLPDDGGASDVMKFLYDDGTIDNLWHDLAFRNGKYDVAVMSIPYDGRWQNGRDFFADVVIDGRTRPDPNTIGLVSWEKHEVEYQLDNAVLLGGKIDGNSDSYSYRFLPPLTSPRAEQVYLGLGYKKDAAGFWSVKHWGNDNYVQLIRMAVERFPNLTFVTTGDHLDLRFSIQPIISKLHGLGIADRLYFSSTDLKSSFNVVSRSRMYVGNDTGMMHVAASCGIPCVGIFNLENSVVKSGPWGCKNVCLEGWKDPVTVEQVLDAMERVM